MKRGQIVAAGVGGTALAALVWLGAALADDPRPAPAAGPGGAANAAMAAGRYKRIEGPRGAIHVWIPPGYQADTGATVVYIHGYWNTADTAWTAHQLPQQFALSALNAMFVAPEAPSKQGDPVLYPDLSEVLRIVEDETGVMRGAAATIAIGHSGGYRTIEAWLDEPLLDQIVMIDALYGDDEVVATWAKTSDRRRLILVAEDTVIGTEAVAQRLGDAVVTLDRFPPSYELWPAEAKTARLLYVRAQFGHMALVADGIVIPSLLRVLGIPRLSSLPWQAPLGLLPPLAGVDAKAR